MKATFEDLVRVMHQLRHGCPWDKEQTWESLRQYILEEAYEVVDAIEHGPPEKVKDEAGDLLFQVVFLAEIAQEKGWWDAADAIANIRDKLVSRHPHVFPRDDHGDLPHDPASEVKKPENVMANWEALKAKERAAGGASSALDGVPLAQPALVRAEKLGKRAARVGFDWRNAEQVLAKVEEEVKEIRADLAKGDKEGAKRELGDLLFACAQAARFLEVNPEDALRDATKTFEKRFRWMEAELVKSSRSPKDAGDDELDRLWEQAKKAT